MSASASCVFARGASLSARHVCIYTRTGDKGMSSLFNGTRRPKDDLYFSALGDVDELNAAIGLAREHCAPLVPDVEAQLATVQSRLIDVGSAVATPLSSSSIE